MISCWTSSVNSYSWMVNTRISPTAPIHCERTNGIHSNPGALDLHPALMEDVVSTDHQIFDVGQQYGRSYYHEGSHEGRENLPLEILL